MTDTPKFTIVDRRKFHADDDTVAEPKAASPAPEPARTPTAQPSAPSAPASGPRLTLVENPASAPKPEAAAPAVAVADEAYDPEQDTIDESQLPPAPTSEESRFQKAAYEKAADRIDDLVRAQNPGAPAPEKIGFEHLVQQLYLSAMMQMGAGTPEGQRPRVDILGARQSIDLLAVVQEKTKGNLTFEEIRTLDTVLFEVRMTFLEITRMISAQPPIPPPPGAGKPGAKR